MCVSCLSLGGSSVTYFKKTKAIVILLGYPRAASVPSLLPHPELQCAQPYMCVSRLLLGGCSVTYFKMTFKRRTTIKTGWRE
jgi:hypothetical protein